MSRLSRISKLLGIMRNPASLITGGIKKVILRGAVRLLQSSGASNKEIWSELKSSGILQGAKQLKTDTGTYLQSLEHVDQIRAISHSSKVPVDLMTETSIPSSRRYRYIAKAQVKYKGVRGIKEKFVSLYTDDYLTLDEYSDQFNDIINQSQYELDYKILSLDYYAVLHQKGDTY